ncbi:MAG TPA: hypothetical protein VIQ74_12935 [Gemmatimonadaceae bacterium]
MPDVHRDWDSAVPTGGHSVDFPRTPPSRGYPKNHVVGVLYTEEQVVAAARTLTGGGFLTSEIHVATGRAAADSLDEITGRGGLAGVAIRIAEALGVTNDEMRLKDIYEEALRHGHFVLGVLAPTEDRKQLAKRILLQHGADSVNFMARFTIERRAPPSAPP